MNTAVSSRDVLMPRGPDRIGPGLMLALIVHVGLIIAIAIGVHWRSRPPEAMSAELWSAVPQVAAPRAQEPAPEPAVTKPAPKPAPLPKAETPPQRQTPDAQIAIEKAKREQERKAQAEEEEAKREEQRKKDQAAAEKRQQELERQQKADEAKREAERKKREDALLAQARKDQERMMGLDSASGEPKSAGSAKQSSGPSASYAGRLIAKIQPNVVYADETPGNPFAEFEVRTAPDGTIVGTPRLTKTSGIPAWDEAALRAIIKTAVLPRDTDGRVPSPMTIALRPRP